MKPKTRQCWDCRYLNVSESLDNRCTKDHKPRFYKQTEDFWGKINKGGLKRKCEDFEWNHLKRLRELRVPVKDGVVSFLALDICLLDNNLSRETFGELFGIQTCPMGGMWAHDVEAVLERMLSGKRTGTQSQAGWD